MIDVIVDTGVWIDELRDRDTPGTRRLRALKDANVALGITDIILAELRAGNLSPVASAAFDRLVESGQVARLLELDDFERAATCARAARGMGTPVRSLADCLIASVCIRDELVLLHSDSDFDALAGCTDLQVLRQ